MCFPTDFTIHRATPLRKSGTTCTSTKVVPIKRASSAKKSVRFSDRDTVAYRPVSKQDLETAWNQRSDIDAIRTGIRETIGALENANGQLHTLDDNEHCLRGLESGISPTIYRLRKFWVKTTHQNVLDEQRLQRAAGIVDVSRLGEIARTASQDAVLCAAKMGFLDARRA